MVAILLLVIVVVIGSVSPGSAEDACACLKHYNPVCGSDGQTYSNNCTLQCASLNQSSLKLQCDGSCPCLKSRSVVAACACQMSYLPVCGSDGVTYSNKCSLDCAAKQQNHLSIECNSACPCPRRLE